MNKKLFIALGLSLLSAPAFTCQISIPESYIPTFLNPPVSGHYEKCESKPKEECFCVDDIDPYTSVMIDEVDDIGIYTGKKLLRNSPVKKIAREERVLTEKSAELETINKKKLLREKLASFDKSKVTTVAALKEFVADIVELLK